MLLIASTSYAQKENPRGIFRLTKLTYRDGSIIKAPIDQYKLSGDSACVMLTYQKKINETTANMDEFMMTNIDEKPFNYTGDKSNEEIGVWIYDSYKTHFTLKWYNKIMNHPLFPSGDWVTEWYDSRVGKSDFANIIINAFRPHESKNKIDGVWKIPYVDNMYIVVYKKNVIMFNATECQYQRQKMYLSCVRMDLSFDGKSKMKFAGTNYDTEWLNDDVFKLVSKNKEQTTMIIWQRAELPPAYKAFFETLKD